MKLRLDIRMLAVAAAVVFGLPSPNLTTSGAAFAVPANEITIPAAKDPNLAEGVKYQDSPAYRTEVAQLVERVKAICKPHIGESNVAVIFDIDETLLDNREEFRRRLASEQKEQEGWWRQAWWDKWVREARAPAIPETAELARWLKDNHFNIFLITGRNSLQYSATESNLLKEQIPFDELFTKPVDYRGRAEDYKTDCRRLLEARGFKILCNIGDQYSDLYGLHSEYCEKMPNKMYFIP